MTTFFVILSFIVVLIIVVKLCSSNNKRDELISQLAMCDIHLPEFQILSVNVESTQQSCMGHGNDVWSEIYIVRFIQNDAYLKLTKTLYSGGSTYCEKRPERVIITPSAGNTARICIDYNIMQ